MTGPLAAAVPLIGSIMNVTLIPFGNAYYRGGKLTCQHGVDECIANSWEQCAISLYPAFDDHFPFYNCLEAASLSCGEGAGTCTLDAAPGCVTSSGLSLTKMQACINSPTTVAALQEEFYQLTPSNHKWTPWVLINGKLSPSDGDELLAEVCDAYTGTKPAACSARKRSSKPCLANSE